MTRNSRKMLILAVFCVAGVISAIPGFLIRSRNSNISSVKSALLNPKYTEDINEITLNFPSSELYATGQSVTANSELSGNRLSFKKMNVTRGDEVWIGSTSEDLVFPVNSTVIHQLIERSSRTVSMAAISDSYSAWNALGLTDEQAVNLVFSCTNPDGNTQQFSSLYFGFENADTSMIYVRTDRKSTSWRISNDYSSYLTDSIPVWADQALLPTGSSDENDPSVTRISFQAGTDSRVLYNTVDTAEEFDDTLHMLLSLRSSDFLSVSGFEREAPHAVPVLDIQLSGTSDAYGLTVYEAPFEDEESAYYVRNYGIISTDKAGYVQRISSWTYSRMKETAGF